jgi:hypothetical protein
METLTTDEKMAFQMGYLRGLSNGPQSPIEAEKMLSSQLNITVTEEMINLFCNGSDDGDKLDTTRLNTL